MRKQICMAIILGVVLSGCGLGEETVGGAAKFTQAAPVTDSTGAIAAYSLKSEDGSVFPAIQMNAMLKTSSGFSNSYINLNMTTGLVLGGLVTTDNGVTFTTEECKFVAANCAGNCLVVGKPVASVFRFGTGTSRKLYTASGSEKTQSNVTPTTEIVNGVCGAYAGGALATAYEVCSAASTNCTSSSGYSALKNASGTTVTDGTVPNAPFTIGEYAPL